MKIRNSFNSKAGYLHSFSIGQFMEQVRLCVHESNKTIEEEQSGSLQLRVNSDEQEDINNFMLQIRRKIQQYADGVGDISQKITDEII